MMRNYTFIAITFIVILAFISVGYLIAQQITNTKPDYDAGIAAYQRGHYRVALYDFESRAKRGDIVAQFCLAFMYKHGYGVTGSKPKEALEWYKKAAEQGYLPAQSNLGVLYVRRAESAAEEFQNLESVIDFGDTKKRAQEIIEDLENAKKRFQLKTTENLENAKKWFQKAAEKDYAPAQYNLYLIALDNHVEWLTKAAKQGYAPAQNQLYYNDQENEKTVEWLRKAAEQNYPVAQNNLGVCYENGMGVKQSYTEAFNWYEQAAKQGNASAYFNLGQNYRLGEGVDRNWKKAVRWYRKAAEKDDADAQNNLAAMYRKRSNKGDHEIANRWLLRAAQQDQAIAQTNIGEYFEKGLGRLPQDDSEAYYWYSLALRNKASREGLRKAENNENLIFDIAEAQDRVAKSLSYLGEIDARIENWKPKQLNSTGTGFYVGKHYILTNAHVVIDENGEELNEFRIPYRRVELLDWDRDVDLALLYDKRGNTNTATFRREFAKFGEKVAVFGYPRSDFLSYEGNIASGIVSGTSYIVGHPQFANRFQYTAPTQRGNSGGPVFDSAGNVIGVYTSQIVDYESFPKESSIGGGWIPQTINLAQNANFAIKFNAVRDFLSKHRIFLSPVDELTAGELLDDKALPEKPAIDIPLENLSTKATTFVVPVLCFKNKGEQPSRVKEVGIDAVRW